MKLVNILFADWMSEAEIQEHQLSDRIWVPRRIFERWMREEDAGSLVIVELDGGAQKVPVCMYAPHCGGNNVIYVPEWVCSELKVSGEPPSIRYRDDEDDEDNDDGSEAVEDNDGSEAVEDNDDAIIPIRKRPHQCSFVKLQPFTSAHIHAAEQLEEPAEDILSRGLEAYTCLRKGQILSILLQTGEVLGLEVLEAQPETDVLCIRAGEIELELLPPLDLLEQELERCEPYSQPITEPTQLEESQQIIAEPEPVQPQETREERRRKLAAAALARFGS